KIAELLPAALAIALTPGAARRIAAREGLASVQESDIKAQANGAVQLTTVARARVPLAHAENTHVIAFRPADGGREHLALIIGSPEPPGPVLVRLHSECLTGDLLGSLKCDCGDQLRGPIRAIGESGAGILLYLAQTCPWLGLR